MHILPLNSRKIYKEHFGARGFEVVAHVNTVISTQKNQKKNNNNGNGDLESIFQGNESTFKTVEAFPSE